MTVDQLFENFTKKRIAIVGDVMIDAYMIGEVFRMSPEAPVPILNLNSAENRLGGAGNVAMNLKALGASAFLVSVIGSDQDGKNLLKLMQNEGLATDGILPSSERITTVKTRIIQNEMHLLRIDSEQTNAITESEEFQMIALLKSLIVSGIDAVIFQDYNKGVLTASGINTMIDLCRLNGILTTVDPKKDNFFAYKNVDLFKPNLKELKEGLEFEFDVLDRSAFESAIHKLESVLACKHTFITLSEHGVFIKKEEEKTYLPAHMRNIADVSGAGDTVITLATLCLTLGLPAHLVAAVANLAGGLVCEHSGVVTIDKTSLLIEVRQKLGQYFQ